MDVQKELGDWITEMLDRSELGASRLFQDAAEEDIAMLIYVARQECLKEILNCFRKYHSMQLDPFGNLIV